MTFAKQKVTRMNTILWILQGLLSAIFFFSGTMKSTRSEHWLVTHYQTGVAGLSNATIKFIGICEILGAFGLILPWWLNIAPILTPVSAMGFCIIMLLAAPRHYRLREPGNVAINVTVFLLCAFVAYGRLINPGL